MTAVTTTRPSGSPRKWATTGNSLTCSTSNRRPNSLTATFWGDDFSASNGAKVSQDDFQSLVGRFGARVGANFAQNKGSLYLHAPVNHDFLGDVDGTARAGARTESLDADLNFYGTLERSHGNDYTDSYRYSVGMRYVF